MAHVADHLSVSALEEKYRSCTDVTAARHVQTIWLLAKGHDIAEVSATVSYARRWVERLLARYNAEGLEALGDLRRRNGTRPSVLKPELLDKLKDHLGEPPPDGGLWSSRKVAAWMAGELGLDRKSTRLNSSHANISYAVFCLKKKKLNTSSTVVPKTCIRRAICTLTLYLLKIPRGTATSGRPGRPVERVMRKGRLSNTRRQAR